jgi:hypothetical protein
VHLDEDDETALGVRMPKERGGGQGRCQGGGGDNEDEGEVSGATLSFICDNERTWLRIALLVKFFAQTDNMSPMRGPRWVHCRVWGLGLFAQTEQASFR